MQQNENFIEVLDPKLDVVFKGLFGKSGNEYILEDLLGCILNRSVKCKEVQKEARVGQERPEEKYGALDIRALLDNGEEVDIEIQMADKKDIVNRAVFYASTLTTMGLKRSQSYLEMKPKIVIFILNFNIFKYPEILQESHISLVNHRDIEITNLHKYYFIELPKIKNPIKNERLKTWIAFLNQDKEMLKMAKEDKIINKAQEELEYLTGDAEVRRLAELRQKALRDELAIKKIAKEEGFDEGMKQGIKDGFEKGMQQGMQQGVEQGVRQGIQSGEQNTKLKIAIELITQNMDNKFISEVTGLTEKQIQELRK